jgi:hypothetical protein
VSLWQFFALLQVKDIRERSYSSVVSFHAATYQVKLWSIYRCYYKYDVDKAWTDVLIRYRHKYWTADDLAKIAIMTAKTVKCLV